MGGGRLWVRYTWADYCARGQQFERDELVCGWTVSCPWYAREKFMNAWAMQVDRRIKFILDFLGWNQMGNAGYVH